MRHERVLPNPIKEPPPGLGQQGPDKSSHVHMTLQRYTGTPCRDYRLSPWARVNLPPKGLCVIFFNVKEATGYRFLALHMMRTLAMRTDGHA